MTKAQSVSTLVLALIGVGLSAPRGAGGEAGRGGAREGASPRTPSVLFVAHRHYGKPMYLRTWHDWLESGFEIDVRPVASVKRLEDLRPFNVVVINFLPLVDAQQNVAAEQIPFEKALAGYVRAGGGVVVFCGGGQFSRMKPAVCHLLEPYGARVEEEQIVDREHVMGWVCEGKHTVNYTTRIERTPMTRGVRRIGYIGQASRADVMKLMMPITFTDPEPWRVVVRGEKTAYSARGKHPSFGPEIKDTPDTYAEHPVMAAWRTVGKGRLFLFPHNVCQTITSPDVFDHFLWDREDGERDDRPENRTFIMQTVAWAAEPSFPTGFGGFRTDRRLRPDEEAILKPSGAVPADWSKAPTGEALAPRMHLLRGLIGAQSTFSGGPHTVQALCAAAREAGLGFLAFTERLELLTPQAWDTLQRECREQSDGAFLALPGLLALDKPGNTHFALGRAVFPTPTAVTPDGKRLDNLAQFWFRVYSTRMTGFASVTANPNPWSEIRKTSGMAVWTFEDGNVADEAIPEFLESSYNMENYLPFCLTHVTTPDQVAAASLSMVNVFTGASLEALSDYVQGRGKYERNMFWERPHPWYLTSGPKLEYNGGINLGCLAVDEERENVFRYGLRISGLNNGDRIRLMDGPEVFREWIAAGDAFQTEHTWPHEQARVFVLQVIRDGETVLMGAPIKLDYGRRFNSCGDRQNSLPFNYQPDMKGNWYVSGIPLHAKYKSWRPNTIVYATCRSWLIGAIGIELNPTLMTGWFTSPHMRFDHERTEGGINLSSYHRHRLSCPGIVIADEVCQRVYPDGGRHGGDQQPPKLTEPLQLFNYSARRYGIYGMIGQLNGQLVESRVTALQDVTLKQTPSYVSSKHYAAPPNVEAWAELSMARQIEHHRAGEEVGKVLKHELVPGDYVGCYPRGLALGGAHYYVSGDLTSWFHVKPTGFSSLFMLNTPSRWQKGQTFDYTIFYTNGGSTPHRPSSDYRNVASFLGFHGPYPAIDEVRDGELLSTPVIATVVTAPDAIVRFRTVKTADAPIGLTVRLRGFNPNWQVVYRLNGSARWRYLGELDGCFYMNLYTNTREHRVMAGHPLLADREDVRIMLDDPNGGQRAFELYNPTEEPMTVRLRTNTGFFAPWSTSVPLRPRESRRVRIDGQGPVD